jgi:hypothetical protein
MPITAADLERLGYVRQPDGSYARPDRSARPAPQPARLPNPEPQRHAGAPLDRAAPPQAAGEGRARLRITRHAPRPLDADNFVGGCKPLIDAIRRAGIIRDDDPASVDITFAQRRSSKRDQRTEIEVWTPQTPY